MCLVTGRAAKRNKIDGRGMSAVLVKGGGYSIAGEIDGKKDSKSSNVFWT